MSNQSRVFSESVVGSEDFVFMQGLSQALYFRLCMNADDKGVISNARVFIRDIGASEEHLQELLDLNLVIQIKDKPRLYVITDWFIHNKPEKYEGKESDFTFEINAAVFVGEDKRYHLLKDKKKIKPYQNQRSKSKDESLEKLGDEKGVSPENSETQKENSEKTQKRKRRILKKLGDEKGVSSENSPEEKRREEKGKEEKRSEEKGKETHTSEVKLSENTETVCADVCVHDESCDQTSCSCQTNTPSVIPDPPSNPPESAIADPPSDPLGDITSNIASDPPDDFDYSPDDDIDDAFEYSKELTAKAEEIRKRLKAAGLGVPDEISWQMRDFKFALDGKRRLHLSDDEFFGALENYAVLLEAKQANPDLYWWKSKPPIGSLFNDGGKGPPINWLLPYAFDLNNFKKGGGNASAPSRRGIDSVSYDASEIAERQAVAVPVYDDASYDDLPY